MNSDFQNIVGQKYISTLKIIKYENTLVCKFYIQLEYSK